MFTHVSQATRDVLAGCGLHDRTVGAGKVMGMDTGERSGKAAHPAIGHRHGGETGPMGMGLEKDAGQGPRQFNREEMRQSRPEGETVGFNYVVHMNHAVPTSTRKTARRRTSAAFLMVVK